MSETATQAPHEADHEALVDMLATDQKAGISPEDAQAYQDLIDYNRDAAREATTQIEIKDANTGAESIAVHKSIGDHALTGQPEWVANKMLWKEDWHKDDKDEYVKDGIRLDESDMAVSSGNWKSHEQDH